MVLRCVCLKKCLAIPVDEKLYSYLLLSFFTEKQNPVLVRNYFYGCCKSTIKCTNKDVKNTTCLKSLKPPTLIYSIKG